jgi:LAO/AO transport system kinase
MIAGAGDELQGIKKGVLELADGIAINKADGDNQDRVARAKKDLENAMHLILPASASWQTPVMTCSSVEKNGTVPVWEKVRAHQDIVKRSGEFDQRRKSQALEWMWTLVEDGLKQMFTDNEAIRREIPVLSRQVQDEKTTPLAAAERLLSYW